MSLGRDHSTHQEEISGDLGQGSLGPLLSYHFLGAYCVLGALHGFSNLNFTVIILWTHLAERGTKADRCVKGTGLGAEMAGCDHFIGDKGGSETCRSSRDLSWAGIGREALCL